MSVGCVGLDRIGDPVSAAEIETFVARLAVASQAVSDGERIDRIGALEGLKAASAAAQARDIVDFADSQLEDQAARGVRAKDQGTGIGSQVGLACRQSPHRGGRMLATARALVSDLPRTLDALSRGETSEYRATVVARETAVLDSEQRRRVDEELGPRLHELGDRAVEAEARGWAIRLDPEAAVERASKAHRDRRVTSRPAPDTMTYLTGLLPVCDGVAVYAAPDAAAKAAAASGDSRSRGQVMGGHARAAGHRHRERGASGGDLDHHDRPCPAGRRRGARSGSGARARPCGVARRWILAVLDLDRGRKGEGSQRRGRRSVPKRMGSTTRAGPSLLRRLYASPDGGQIVTMESKPRHFPRQLRRRDDVVESEHPRPRGPPGHTDRAHLYGPSSAGAPRPLVA